MSGKPVVSVRTYALVFAALLVLTALTTAVAFVGEGLREMTTLAIAVCKAVLVILYFMHVRWSPRLTWIVAGAMVRAGARVLRIRRSGRRARGRRRDRRSPSRSLAHP